MLTTLALFTVVTVAGESPTAVHLTRGQELVYRGSFSEASKEPAAERRACELEARAYVLDTGPTTAEVAFLTVLRTPGSGGDAAVAARLDVGTVDARGRVTMQRSGGPPRVPLDGPAPLEAAGFVELPAIPVATWDVGDGHRPPREWRTLGDDFRPGARCIKLVGEQESDQWRHPTDNATAWRRTETAWLSPTSGLVQRLERSIELRNPDGSSRGAMHTEYERVETSALHATTDQRREIAQAIDCDVKLAALFLQPERARRPADFAAVAERIDSFTSMHPPTPYRSAMVALRRRAEAAARGEVPPPGDPPDPPPPPPAVGRTAPDFVTTELTSGDSMRLARWRGKPAVLFFIRPDNAAAGPTLQLAADLQSRYAGRLHVAVLVVSDEDRARPAWTAFGVPLFAGGEPARLCGLSRPSDVLVIDGEGLVRHMSEVGPGIIGAVQKLLSGP